MGGGAAGGVNTASIQVAALAGARVMVVGSNAKKLELAEELGAHVLIDRSKEENWSKTVFFETGKRGVDVVWIMSALLTCTVCVPPRRVEGF